MNLPSEYRKVYGVRGDYIDTGILSQSGLKIEVVMDTIFTADDKYAGGLFGARNTNSNTSLGQLNVYQYASGFYFGYNNGRANITMPSTNFGSKNISCKFVLEDNSISINQQCVITKTATRTAVAFTGTRNIYVGAVNNGGNVEIAIPNFITTSFKIIQNDIVIRDYVPCERLSDGVIGLYDLANNTFNVGATNGFTASGTLVELGNHDNGAVSGDFGYVEKTTLKAYPNDGYSFKGWYINGSLISTENPYTFTPTIYNSVVDAEFVKTPDIDFSIGWKLIAQDRFVTSLSNRPHFYEMVLRSGEINESAIEKSVSKFQVDNIPSTVKVGSLVMVYNPKGKKVYQGVVESINNNELCCREALSYFDTPYLFHNNKNNSVLIGNGMNDITTIDVQYALQSYIKSLQNGIYNTDNILNDETNLKYIMRFVFSSPDRDNYIDAQFPLIESTEVKNFEEFLFDMFNQFGITTDIQFVLRNPQIVISCNYDTSEITLSNNIEMSDLNIDVEYTNTNLLYVYNASGTSFRGLLKLDGVDTNRMPGTIPAKEQMIMSDEALNNLKLQYIDVYNYNHKIDLQLKYPNKFYSYDELKEGQRVKFYVGNELYESIITALSYNISDRTSEIREVKYTLGKARSSLTYKLNLGKIK